MEEMRKELGDRRAEVESLAAELRAKSDRLKHATADQDAKLHEARAEAERRAWEAASEQCGQLTSRLTEKEQALRQLCVAHEKLKGTLREKTEELEAGKRELVAALENSENKRQEQETTLRARDGEIARLRGLLSEKERKCSDAEQQAWASREVMMRDDMLVKLEEEKAAVEGKLKWKTEQFRHLEDALKKVQDDFEAAKREWGSDRSNLVDRIIALETELDSKTRIAEDFRSRLEMCSQALSREEGRRKRVQAEMSELRHLYGNVVSEFEEARSTIESLTAKRDGEIAALRGTLAEKGVILKEMGYSKAHLEQENEDLRSSLKEYQEAQIGGADAVVSLKDLREKFRALEHTHRSCTAKLRDKESEWRIQMEKLGSDLDGCLSKLDSRDILVSELQDELQHSNRSLEQQTLESWEASVLLAVLQSKLNHLCSYIDAIKLNMQHHYENLEKEIAASKKQLEDKNYVVVQLQGEQKQQSEAIAKLHGRIEELEYMEQEHEKMQIELNEYKEMLENRSRDVYCLKDEASDKERSLQEELRKALGALHEANFALADRKNELNQLELNLHQQKQAIEHLEKLRSDMETVLKVYMDDNCILKRDLDAALAVKMQTEELLREEKVKLLGALDEANCDLADSKSELSQLEIGLRQQKQDFEDLEKLKDSMETELKGYMDDTCALRKDLDAALVAKVEAELLKEEKLKLIGALNEANSALSEKESDLSQLEISCQQHKEAVEHLEKLKIDMATELKICMDEKLVLKRDLDVALIAKLEAESSHTEEKDKLCGIINKKEMLIDELQQYVIMLEEENMGRKLDLGSLIKLEYEKFVQEVNSKYSESTEMFNRKLLELERRLNSIEHNFSCRVQEEIMEMFDQEEADWYALIADKEIAVRDIQRTVESVQQDVKQLLEAATAKVAEVQLEIKQLYGFAETLNSLYIIQEHDSVFKDMLIAEYERELGNLCANFLLEKEQSGNLKNLLEKLRAETTAEMLQKAKEHQEVTARSSLVLQERNELVHELTNLTNSIGEVVHRDEDLLLNFKQIMKKVDDWVHCNDSPSSEKSSARSSASLVRNKSGHLPDRRLPLKENNY
jgi:chromosome segregation ATPase